MTEPTVSEENSVSEHDRDETIRKGRLAVATAKWLSGLSAASLAVSFGILLFGLFSAGLSQWLIALAVATGVIGFIFFKGAYLSSVEAFEEDKKLALS